MEQHSLYGINVYITLSRSGDLSSLPSENILQALRGKGGAMVLPLCGSTLETDASEGKAVAMMLPLCRATVETDASEGKAEAMVLPLCGSTVETEASEG